MSKYSVRVPALRTLASALEGHMAAARRFVDSADAQVVSLAMLDLMSACHGVIDQLESWASGKAIAIEAAKIRAKLADRGFPAPQDLADALCDDRMGRLRDDLVAAGVRPIAGGAPEPDESDEASFGDECDPNDWPAWTDNWHWTPDDDGPTPLDVLAASSPRYEPTPEDWSDYAAQAPAGLSETDHVAAVGCC